MFCSPSLFLSPPRRSPHFATSPGQGRAKGARPPTPSAPPPSTRALSLSPSFSPPPFVGHAFLYLFAPLAFVVFLPSLPPRFSSTFLFLFAFAVFYHPLVVPLASPPPQDRVELRARAPLPLAPIAPSARALLLSPSSSPTPCICGACFSQHLRNLFALVVFLPSLSP